MIKRIIIGILTVVLSTSLLVGCSFVTHDNERDLRQQIVHVASYDIVNYVTEDEETTEHTFKTEEKSIYKRDLVEYVNSNSSSLSQSFGTNYERLYRYVANLLVDTELVNNEVDALLDCGKIEWGVAQDNAVKKNLYGVIDNTILSLKNTILSNRDQEEIPTDEDEEINDDTTFPVKPDEEDNEEIGDNEEVYDSEPWEPARVDYPGLFGDDAEQSLGREAMRRFIALIKSRVEDDFRITAKERKLIDEEFKAIDEVIDTQGVSYVYPLIGNYPVKEGDKFGHIMYYISGKTLERSQKVAELQDYLTNGVEVPNSEVVSSYTATLNEQRSRYADVSVFDSDVSAGTSTILYYPNNNYFYVKHILLPFSDEQTAALTEYEARPDIANLQESEREAKVHEFRARLADSIVCYPHKDGENDMSKPMTVDEVMAHIRSVMLPLQANVQRANNAFNDLIYLYNTDPGAFGNDKGYIVKYKLNDGESETYMQEFADAARIMRDTLAPGQVYYEKVITDFGVHIMYFASVTRAGAVSLYDYTTPGRNETYYDVLEEPIRTNRESAAYRTWENRVLSDDHDDYTTLYVGRFSDLWGR